MQSTVSVIGITGSGKTDFALQAASQLIADKKFDHVALISADSRQVYQGLEIISGADIPAEFELQNVEQQPLLYPYFLFQDKTVSLHGVSIVSPESVWSLGHFKELVQTVHQHYQGAKTAFLVVGGTGLYHRWLYQPDFWQSVPPNEMLRATLQTLSVAELQNQLQEVSPTWFATLNQSDQHNPRRLIRAIERAHAGVTPDVWQQQSHTVQWIGLKDQELKREIRIRQRVEARLAAGAIKEVEQLKATMQDAIKPVWSTLGVSQILQYLNTEITAAELVTRWTQAELSYCKRQLTWFAREPIIWIPSGNDRFEQAYAVLAKQLLDS